ncbi:hypothetical protein M9H77_23155 [Catharanthus roseus]|uniref:Uncharacterized protein n=1 Tax=Catharanthus roseus TaxID=4058 RepID=A0ACC0ATQ3_CATRO|nr:hypothetical protein M9H77_23155 [Catharanthus roseus]
MPISKHHRVADTEVTLVVKSIGAFIFKQGQVDAQHGAQRHKVDIYFVTILDSIPKMHHNGRHIATVTNIRAGLYLDFSPEAVERTRERLGVVMKEEHNDFVLAWIIQMWLHQYIEEYGIIRIKPEDRAVYKDYLPCWRLIRVPKNEEDTHLVIFQYIYINPMRPPPLLAPYSKRDVRLYWVKLKSFNRNCDYTQTRPIARSAKSSYKLYNLHYFARQLGLIQDVLASIMKAEADKWDVMFIGILIAKVKQIKQRMEEFRFLQFDPCTNIIDKYKGWWKMISSWCFADSWTEVLKIVFSSSTPTAVQQEPVEESSEKDPSSPHMIEISRRRPSAATIEISVLQATPTKRDIRKRSKRKAANLGEVSFAPAVLVLFLPSSMFIAAFLIWFITNILLGCRIADLVKELKAPAASSERRSSCKGALMLKCKTRLPNHYNVSQEDRTLQR